MFLGESQMCCVNVATIELGVFFVFSCFIAVTLEHLKIIVFSAN